MTRMLWLWDNAYVLQEGRLFHYIESLAKRHVCMYFTVTVPYVSVYVDSDAVRLYRAGKASGWHAGVLLAAPTVVSPRWGVEARVTKFKI